MKKTLIAIMLAMAVLLTACGSDAPAEKTPEKAPVQSAEETPETVPEETEAPEAPEEPEERNVSAGRMEGDRYVNEYAGYAIDLSNGWTVSSAEMLQALPEQLDEILGDSELWEEHSELEQFTDILAENTETLQTMNLLYRKMSLQERLGYAMMSEQEILEGILSMQEQMAEAYQQAGILVENMEIVDITFLEQPRKAILTTTTTEGVPYITLQIFDVQRGGYALTLTLASLLENTTESMLDLFTSVE